MTFQSLKKIIFFLSLFSLFVTSSLPAQKLHKGEWKTYTAMSSITDLAVRRATGNVWAATSGGAFRFTPSAKPKDSIIALRNTDGLSDNNLTTIAADSNGRIYFGGELGTFDIYTESSGTITSVRDIYLSSYVRKRINAIAAYGDTIYLATAFGLSIYDASQKIFSETVTKFGSLNDQDTVFGVTVANDSIYVALSGAIAIASKRAPSLKDPAVWRIIPADSGGTLNAIISLTSGKIIVGGSAGIFGISGNSLKFISTGDSISVLRLSSYGTTLFILDSRRNKILRSDDLEKFSFSDVPYANGEQNIAAFALSNAGAEILGFGSGGIDLQPPSGALMTAIFPDGPLLNDIADLDFTAGKNELWASINSGISIFDPATGIWKNLERGKSILPNYLLYTNSFYDSTRSVHWIGTYGGGLFSLSPDLATIKHLGNANGIPGVNSDSDQFIVIGKCKLDRNNAIISGTWTKTGRGFVKSTNGITFQATQLNPAGDLISTGVVAQDSDGYYFVGTVDAGASGSFGVFAIDQKTGNIFSIPGDGTQLTSPTVNALVVDLDNGLWCGTNAGVNVLTHSSDFTGKVTFNKPRALPFTNQQIVKCIAVDGVGNKWVGTANGVFILSPDGSDSLAHFTTANSPLIDNTVATIAIDIKNGEAYLGTPSGISRVSSIYEEGEKDFSKMQVSPNPIIQTSDNAMTVTISGLSGGSTVKIYSTSGRLVATIDGSQLGSTVTWNGRDENGKLLTSGVYVAAAASPDTSDYGETKFVVIRK